MRCLADGESVSVDGTHLGTLTTTSTTKTPPTPTITIITPPLLYVSFILPHISYNKQANPTPSTLQSSLSRCTAIRSQFAGS